MPLNWKQVDCPQEDANEVTTSFCLSPVCFDGTSGGLLLAVCTVELDRRTAVREIYISVLEPALLDLNPEMPKSSATLHFS